MRLTIMEPQAPQASQSILEGTAKKAPAAAAKPKAIDSLASRESTAVNTTTSSVATIAQTVFMATPETTRSEEGPAMIGWTAASVTTSLSAGEATIILNSQRPSGLSAVTTPLRISRPGWAKVMCVK